LTDSQTLDNLIKYRVTRITGFALWALSIDGNTLGNNPPAVNLTICPGRVDVVCAPDKLRLGTTMFPSVHKHINKSQYLVGKHEHLLLIQFIKASKQ
jgi:hypothetical protein